MALEAATVTVVVQLATLFGLMFGVFKYVNALIAAVRKDSDVKIEKCIELEAKARHTLRNDTSTVSIELRRDLELMKRESVRRDEMLALEARLVGRTDKIEVKLDHLGERMVGLAALDPQVKSISDRLERLLTRTVA